MTVFGWIVCLCLLICMTFIIFACWRFGGYEFGFIEAKEYWWLAPLAVFDGVLWYLLFVNSPFTLIVR